MILWILIVIFLVGVFASYMLGVKKEQAWGRPVLILCVVGVVCVVGVRYVRGRQGGLSLAERLPNPTYEVTKRLAGALQPSLPYSPRIFIITSYAGQPRRMDGYKAQWEKALSEVLGEWESAGVTFASQSAEGFSAAVERAEGPIAAIISLDPLPADLEKWSIYELAEPPKVGAYFGPNVDLQALRSWLQKGLIQAAVVKQGARLRLYTANDLP